MSHSNDGQPAQKETATEKSSRKERYTATQARDSGTREAQERTNPARGETSKPARRKNLGDGKFGGAVSRTAVKKTAAAKAPPVKAKAKTKTIKPVVGSDPIELGELSELLGYSLKRAQLRVFDDFLRCVSSLHLTPAQFSVLLLLDNNPGRNQTEIANTLGIQRPNFVAMLDVLEGRGLCQRTRSQNDRRSHVLLLTDSGREILAKAKKIVADKHEARLSELLGSGDRAALLRMLAMIAREF